jgi:hypothetical protein
MKHSYVPVTVEQFSSVAPKLTFERIMPIDLTLIFKGWGPLPAVVGIDNQPPCWDRAGLSRNPRFSDGGTADEKLSECDPPHSFAYEISGFTNSLGWMVDRIRGEWTMTPDGNGTLVRWTYSFYPLPGRRFLIRTVLAPLWRRYAEQVLAAAIDIVERHDR